LYSTAMWKRLICFLAAVTGMVSAQVIAAAPSMAFGDEPHPPKLNTPAFVFSAHCEGKCGSRGTVVYELKNGQWKRKGPIVNFWEG
jgi:hypothetical protein